MKIASFSENLEFEKRISVTPEIASKYLSLGFEVILKNNYGKHLGFEDNDYIKLGVKFASEDQDLVNDANIFIQHSLPSDNQLSILKSDQTLIGVFNPYENKDKLENLTKKIKYIFTRNVAKNNSCTINGYFIISS